MSGGNGAKFAVFAAVLLVTGGLGYLLYQAGDTPEGVTGDETTGEDGKPVKKKRFVLPPDEPPPPPPPTPRAPEPGMTVPIPIEGYDDLALRHWPDAADAFVERRKFLLDEFENGAPRPEEKERWNAQMKAAEKYAAFVAGAPPSWDLANPSTPHWHPAFAVNLMAAMLERAHLPLTQAQTERLAALAKERGALIDESTASLKEDDGRTYMIDKLIARGELFDRFYAEAYSALTPAQADLVSPEKGRGRMRSDAFSSESVWMRTPIPLPYKDPEVVVNSIANGLANDFDIVPRIEEVRPIVREWMKTATGDIADVAEGRGFAKLRRVALAARNMSVLLHRIVDELKLEPPATDKARSIFAAYVPLPL